MEKEEDNKLEEFVDFITDNYTVNSGEIKNIEFDEIESKEEVVAAFKTMYGQCRI